MKEIWNGSEPDLSFKLSILASLVLGGIFILVGMVLQRTGKCSRVPGVYGILFLGEALEYYKSPVEFCKNRFLKYGNIFKTRLFGSEVVFVKGRSAIKLFATGPENGLGAAPEAYLYDTPMYSFNPKKRRSVLMSENDHQHSFKHLTLLTTSNLLMNQPGFLNIRIRDAMTKWFISVTVPSNTNVCGVTLVRDIFLNLTIALLFREVVNKEKLEKQLASWFKMKVAWPFNWFSSDWVNGQKSMKELEAFLADEIQIRLKSDKGYGEDLIGSYLYASHKKSELVNNGKPLQETTEKTILSDCFTFVDSFCNNIACACVWLMVCLEQAPGIKQVLITEVRNYQGEFDIPTIQNPTYLPYLTATIEETMRIYGFLQTTQMKRIALCDIDFEGVHIPQGTPVFLPLSSLNFSEDFFPCSTTFDPLRFMPGGANHETGGSYSFGIGHHACPGAGLARAIMKVFAFTLLEGFDFAATPEQSYEPIFQRSTISSKYSKSTVFPIPAGGMMYSTFSPRPTRMETMLKSR